MLLAALALFGWAGYATVWTNAVADGATDDALTDLRQRWRSDAADAPAPAPGAVAAPSPGDQPAAPERVGEVPAPSAGRPFAVMRVPRLGEEWEKPVIEGSGSGPGGMDDGDLRRGVVHYPGTSLPGMVGNFAVAGHRAGNGEPFRHLDRLRPGDEVTVETVAERLTFRVSETRIVAPEDGAALLPVPFRAGTAPDSPSLTLSTCHPRLISTQRLVVVAGLVARASLTR